MLSPTDKSRFAAIVKPHYGDLYRAAVRLTRSGHDAEDLVQDVCVRAAAHLSELVAAADPKAWLMRVQYRLFVDGRRRQLRSPVRAGNGTSPENEFAAQQPGIDESVDSAAAVAGLTSAWGKLGAEQQALLALHAEGYDLTEIATITGLGKGALSARLYRARARLARALKDRSDVCLSIERLEI